MGYVFVPVATDYTADQHAGLVSLRYWYETVPWRWPDGTSMDRRRLGE
ncbi:MAG: hypothetical protein OXJ37_02620 [Bryobacterales bacterium]|nr:hypothetical protein [Bryobacterales bacterium]MDE0622557.1 hypothetical protein [Bryobacterales bacterium]